MKNNINTVDAEIKTGARFEGDDSFWICEAGCEDLGPFDTRDAAEAFFAQHIGPTGQGDSLPIDDTCHARKYTNFRDGEPDIGEFDCLDSYIEAACEGCGLEYGVVKAYHDAGYYIANGGLVG